MRRWREVRGNFMEVSTNSYYQPKNRTLALVLVAVRLAISRNGFEEGPPQENVNQVSFIFGAAFVIVDQVCVIGDESRGFRQPFFDLRARAREQLLCRECPAGKWADAAHRDASSRKRAAAIGTFEPQSQAQRGALMNLKFHVSGAMARFCRRHHNPGEDFARREMIRICAGNELLDENFASPGSAFDPHR